LDLQGVFFSSSFNLSILIHHASQCIGFSNVFNLITHILDFLSGAVHTSSELLASTILLFQEISVVFHSLVFPVRFSEQLKGFGSVSEVFKRAVVELRIN